ncbi:MAG: hypothetical protein ACLRXQ_06755 [Phascolarctobacterium faecium]
MAEETAARDSLLQFARQHVTEAENFSWLAEVWDKRICIYRIRSMLAVCSRL